MSFENSVVAWVPFCYSRIAGSFDNEFSGTSSLSQERLNYNIIAMTHKESLDMIKLEEVLNCFTSRTDIRKAMFGINKF